MGSRVTSLKLSGSSSGYRVTKRRLRRSRPLPKGFCRPTEERETEEGTGGPPTDVVVLLSSESLPGSVYLKFSPWRGSPGTRTLSLAWSRHLRLDRQVDCSKGWRVSSTKGATC